MKKTKAKQPEFGFKAEPFALVGETGEDTTRSSALCNEAKERLALFEAAQPSLVPVNQTRCPTCAALVASIFDHIDIDCQHD